MISHTSGSRWGCGNLFPPPGHDLPHLWIAVGVWELVPAPGHPVIIANAVQNPEPTSHPPPRRREGPRRGARDRGGARGTAAGREGPRRAERERVGESLPRGGAG